MKISHKVLFYFVVMSWGLLTLKRLYIKTVGLIKLSDWIWGNIYFTHATLAKQNTSQLTAWLIWWVGNHINIVSFKPSTHLAFPSLFESSYLPFYGLNICKVVFCIPCKCVFNIRCVIPLCICLPGLPPVWRNFPEMFTQCSLNLQSVL